MRLMNTSPTNAPRSVLKNSELLQSFQNMAAFVREVLDDLDELPPSVTEAVGQQALEAGGRIAR